MQCVTRESEVERLIRKRNVLRVAECERDVAGIRFAGRSLRHGEHRGCQIETDNPADMPRKRQRERSGPASEVHGPIAFLCRDHLSQDFRLGGARLHHRLAEHICGAGKLVAYEFLLSVGVQICHLKSAPV